MRGIGWCRVVTVMFFCMGVLSIFSGWAQAQATADGKSMLAKGASVGASTRNLSSPQGDPSQVRPLLTVRNLNNQPISYEEVEKVYLTACSVVQQTFGKTVPNRAGVTLVVGASAEALDYPKREIMLNKWDKRMFAQGVVILAFEDLLSVDERLRLSALAVNWADATVNASDLRSGRGEDKNAGRR